MPYIFWGTKTEMSLEKETELPSAAKSHSQSTLEIVWLSSSLIISSRHSVLNSAEVCQSQGFTVQTWLRHASHRKDIPIHTGAWCKKSNYHLPTVLNDIINVFSINTTQTGLINNGFEFLWVKTEAPSCAPSQFCGAVRNLTWTALPIYPTQKEIHHHQVSQTNQKLVSRLSCNHNWVIWRNWFKFYSNFL